MKVIHAVSMAEVLGIVTGFLAQEGRGRAVLVLPCEEQARRLLTQAGVSRGREIIHGQRRIHVLWELEHGFTFNESELVVFYQSWLLTAPMKTLCLTALGVILHAAPNS